MSSTFKNMLLSDEISQTLDRLNFTEPTSIQSEAIPFLIENKSVDLHAQAQTGTGKTLAFGIPLLMRIDKEKKHPQAVVLAPTRELAVQIYDNLKPFFQDSKIAGALLYGGMPISDQIDSLKRGAQVIIGTPGRINDLLIRKSMSFDLVNTLVLDEADVLFDMGFKEEIEDLIAKTNPKRELWLFAATIKPTIREFREKFMKNPKEISISKSNVGNALIKQHYAIVPFNNRTKAIVRFIDKTSTDFYGFIFCQTKLLAAEVADQLSAKGYRASALHGDMSQDQRNLVVKKMRNKELRILVATDVAARGLDIPDLTHVINYSLPEDNETYVHRVGRTGRAGKEGIAISFIGGGELRKVEYLVKRFNLVIDKITVPTREEVVGFRFERLKEFFTETKKEVSSSISEFVKELHNNILNEVNMLSSEELKNAMSSLIKARFFNDIESEDQLDKAIQNQSSYSSERSSSSSNRRGGFSSRGRSSDRGGFSSGDRSDRSSSFRSGFSSEGRSSDRTGSFDGNKRGEYVRKPRFTDSSAESGSSFSSSSTGSSSYVRKPKREFGSNDSFGGDFNSKREDRGSFGGGDSKREERGSFSGFKKRSYDRDDRSSDSSSDKGRSSFRKKSY